jgi:hypothetical protein
MVSPMFKESASCGYYGRLYASLAPTLTNEASGRGSTILLIYWDGITPMYYTIGTNIVGYWLSDFGECPC